MEKQQRDQNKKRIVAIIIILFLAIACLCLGIIFLRKSNHTINFYNGSEIVKTINVKDGEKIKNNQIPSITKTGYNLKWYSDSILTIEYNFDKPIKKDINIYAGWTPQVIGGITNEVMFDYSGGTGIVFEQEFEVGTTITQSDLPDATESGAYRQYFDFIGWSITELPAGEGTTEDLFKEYKITEIEIVFYSVWARQTLGVKFYHNVGNDDKSIIPLKRGITNSLPNPTDIAAVNGDYVINAWYTEIENVRVYYSAQLDFEGVYDLQFETELEFYAVWATDYKTFNFGEVKEASQTVAYNIQSKIKNTVANGGPVGHIIIPRFYEGKEITGIASANNSSSGAFYNCTGITGVTLHESLISIGGYAFYSLKNMVGQLKIPDSVKTIGYCAFWGCLGLNSLTIGDNVTTIDGYAFYYTSLAGQLTIPNSVTTIGTCAFAMCNVTKFVVAGDHNYFMSDGYGVLYTKDGKTLKQFSMGSILTSYTIPSGVVTIGEYSFARCGNLTSVGIPSSVTTIKDYAFWEAGLTTVNIPSNVKTIGQWAFYGSNLTSATIGGVETIGFTVFGYCTRLISVTFGSGAKIIGEYMFNGCTSLTSVTISNSVTLIRNAFQGCTALREITIPSSVTNIEASAFQSCTNLTIFAEFESRPAGWDINWNAMGWGAEFFCPVVWLLSEDYLGRYIFTAINGGTSYSIRAADTSISGNVIIPNRYKDGKLITAIGSDDDTWFSGAFANCSSITSIEIPDAVTSIGEGAFYNCHMLNSITIPSSVTSIGGYAFQGCFELNMIIIPASIENIGEFAFAECHNLTIYAEFLENEIPDGWNINWNPFNRPVMWMLSLFEFELIEFGENEGTYRIRALNTNITGTLIIPSTYKGVPVTEIGSDGDDYSSGAFADCFNITSVIIPGSIKFIGPFAFYNCERLETATIENGVQRIWHLAFANCRMLNKIIIPDSVTEISSDVFENCISLTKIYIPSSVFWIGDFAFRNCYSLTIYTQYADEFAHFGWMPEWNPNNCQVIYDISLEDFLLLP